MQTTPTDRPCRPALARWLAATVLVLLAACGGGSESTASERPTAEAAQFSVEVTPASASVFPGSAGLLTVTLTRTAGFTADVTVALRDPPLGVTAEPQVFSGSVASLQLPVNLSGSVALGSLVLGVSASSGTSSASANTQLNVQPAPPPRATAKWQGTVDTTLNSEFGGATTRMISHATLAFVFDEAQSNSRVHAYTVRSGDFSFQSRTDIPQRNPPCRSIATGSGTVRPQNTPMDLSDGASSGTVATFASDAGTPAYRVGGVLVFTTLTVIDNCNDRNVDVTSAAPMFPVVLWVPQDGQIFDLKQSGTAMQESRSFQVGPETRSSTWNLKTE
jgi:hypothetical protein